MLYNVLIFIFAVIVGNFVEYIVHKYVLHGLGANKKSIWSFHWHEHHNIVRKNNGLDPSYNNKILSKGIHNKEIYSLLFGFLLILPILYISTAFFIGLTFHIFLYYFLHKQSHLNVNFCKKYMPWHYDHHMGKNQNLNWCVTFPLFDYVFKTRKKYL